jgi:hypothetical protein
VRSAPAKLISERVLDVLAGGISIAIQQRLCRHDYAARAVTALGSLLVDECLLQRVQLLTGAQSFERDDWVFSDVAHGNRACPNELATHDGGACPTLSEPAPNFGPLKPRSLRSTYSSGASRSASAEWGLPLTIEMPWSTPEIGKTRQRPPGRFVLVYFAFS